jgi:hypothetical protein
MSLERQDVRAKLDPDDHRALVRICDVDGVTIAEFVEKLLVPVIRKRVHDANLLARDFPLEGISGNGRESGHGGRR